MREKIKCCTVILIAGLFLGGCGAVHLRGTVPDYKEEVYTASAEIMDIVIQEEDVPVQIFPSDNGELYVSYYDADDGSETYKITEVDGELTVTKQSESNFGIFIFGDQYSSDSYKRVKLTVFLPEDYRGGVSVQTMDGDILIGEITAVDFTIRTNDGDVSFDRTTIKNSLNCRTKDGDVGGTFAGSISDYSFKANGKTERHDVNTDADSYKRIDVTTGDGDIHISFDDTKEVK